VEAAVVAVGNAAGVAVEPAGIEAEELAVGMVMAADWVEVFLEYQQEVLDE